MGTTQVQEGKDSQSTGSTTPRSGPDINGWRLYKAHRVLKDHRVFAGCRTDRKEPRSQRS